MPMSELFGSMVFDDRAMKKRLPKKTYKELKGCCELDLPLSPKTASIIASEMKKWAVERGVTHFTHWFQPMTGITAEKHNSFITPQKNGGVIMELSGRELIKGESDASAFPNGGLRSTFEARGYTTWDPTSYAFIKDGILCIPTAFCSYNGNALDKKTPLLRSMEAINTQGIRLMRALGKKAKRISVEVGAEQEYFLIDSALFEKRKDLFYTGRTLFGARPPKGQELNDHYFGAIKPRVVKYMKELDEELWRLGILAKTKHNEAAPSQHEFAPIFTSVNVATDQNQLTMELMKRVAARHGMTCLLHEKPFQGVNGSGKHNNWSISADGTNLLDPGSSPQDNAQFLLFLCAVIAAVDKHQDLLRISVASASNDLRLGSSEAPPAIISIFLGDELTGILQAVADGRSYSRRAKCEVQIGVHVLPKFAMDSSDRNRTSPLAFTGNKFEFRMPGASQSIADANLVLNTIVAEQLELFASELDGSNDINSSITKIIRRVINEHGRIIFNGNSYSQKWTLEAKARGLAYLKSTVDALPYLTSQKNIALFEGLHVFNEAELRSRQEIYTQNYCKLINIEAMTMLDIAALDIIPSVIKYKGDVARSANQSLEQNSDIAVEKGIIESLDKKLKAADKGLEQLKLALEKAHSLGENLCGAACYHDEVLSAMDTLRRACDELELATAREYWQLPDYGELLFSIH